MLLGIPLSQNKEELVPHTLRRGLENKLRPLTDLFRSPRLDRKSEGCRESNGTQKPERVFIESFRFHDTDQPFLGIVASVKKIDYAPEIFFRNKLPQTARHGIDREITATQVRRQIGAFEVRKIELKNIALCLLYHADNFALLIKKEKASADPVGECTSDRLGIVRQKEVDVADILMTEQEIAHGTADEVNGLRSQRKQLRKVFNCKGIHGWFSLYLISAIPSRSNIPSRASRDRHNETAKVLQSKNKSAIENIAEGELRILKS